MPSAATGMPVTCPYWVATTRPSKKKNAPANSTRSLIFKANLARSYYWGRRYDEAITQAKRTLQLDPGFGVALFWLEGSFRHKGMFKEAVVLRQAVATPEQAKVIAQKFKTAGFAALLREGGEKFKNGGALIEAARSYAAIGDKETALLLLEDCYQRRCSSIVTLKAEPDFDDLRFGRTIPRTREPHRATVGVENSRRSHFISTRTR
jgi:tetratricopeptide (TPR) repeat protein